MIQFLAIKGLTYQACKKTDYTVKLLILYGWLAPVIMIDCGDNIPDAIGHHLTLRSLL